MNAPKTLLVLMLALGFTAGCQTQTSPESTDSHDHGHDHGHHHHDRPTTLAAAVHQLEEIRDEVKSAMEGGSPDDAHEPLHEVGELLEILPEIAADTELPREKWEEVKAETEKLFDTFGVIDEAFHAADGDKKAAYEQVAAEIDGAIARLTVLLPLAGETVPDHDGHDGDHDHDREE